MDGLAMNLFPVNIYMVNNDAGDILTNLTVPPPTLSGTLFLNSHFLAITSPGKRK